MRLVALTVGLGELFVCRDEQWLSSLYSYRKTVLSFIFGRVSVSGWWCNNHLERYESQWEGLSYILWKIKNVPNHQPGNVCCQQKHGDSMGYFFGFSYIIYAITCFFLDIFWYGHYHMGHPMPWDIYWDFTRSTWMKRGVIII